MQTITKREIVERVSNKTGIPQNYARTSIQSFLDEIRCVLGEGDRIELRTFGVFEVIEGGARKARNPKTGKLIHIQPKNRVKFRPSKVFGLTGRKNEA